jgi:2,3-diketo-5-methylthio-1-phosphopentane phosphatase
VLVDFDGTIASVDTTDALLERFAEPQWQAIEEEWKAGRIGSRECMVRQIDLVRATPAALDRFIAGIEIDPAFADFAADCRARGLDVMVVSDGLDRTVGAVLARHGLDLPFRANRLEHTGADRWRLSFPHARSACRALAGNCKCRFAEGAAPAPSPLSVVVGDGRSDFCVAERADYVLAKAGLLKHARYRRLPHDAFEDFAEARVLLARWLDAVPSARQRPPDGEAMHDE